MVDICWFDIFIIVVSTYPCTIEYVFVVTLKYFFEDLFILKAFLDLKGIFILF